MFKRLLLSVLLLASNALALPSDNNGGPLANIEAGRSYIRSIRPTLFLDPDYIGRDRENLNTYSEDFTNAAYTKNALAVSGNTLTAAAGTASHNLQNTVTLEAGETYRCRFDIEKGNYQYATVGDTGDGPWHVVPIDLTNGTLGTGANVSNKSITVVSGTRYIVQFEFTRTAAGNGRCAVGFGSGLSDVTIPSTTLAGTETIKLYSNQIQRASQNATYTATTTTALYGASPTMSSVNVVSAINTLYGSTAAFTQSSASAKPILSRPDRVENVQLNSETLTTGVWSPIRATTSANSTTAPDGATTADTLIESVDNATHLLSPSGVALVSGTTYRFSVYAKTKERSQIRMLLSGSTPNTAVQVNTTTCAEVSTVGSPLNKTYTQVGDGWCKISFEVAANATGSAYQEIYLGNAGSISYAGDGTSGIYLWGAQVQRSSMQPTYIATTTAPVYGSLTGRRMLTLDGSNDGMSSTSKSSDIFGTQAKEAFAVMHTNALNVNQYYFTGFDNYWAMRVPSSGSTIGMLNYDGTTDQVNTSASANTTYVANFYHDTTNIGHRLNNGAFTTTASGASSNLNNVLWVGQTGAAGAYFNGQLGPIITFNRVLTWSERDMVRQILQKFWRVS